MSGGTVAGRSAWLMSALGCAVAAMLALGFIMFGGVAGGSPAEAAASSVSNGGTHLGVASCAGSTCHGRSEPTGAEVRQDEILRWQDESSAGGAHSRALRVIETDRGRAIASRLGIGDPGSAPMCLGCHAEPAGARGPRFQKGDGIGCESCHGAASGWIEVHKVTDNHATSVHAGLTALENPKVRAGVCLDCHFGSDRPGQFVNHKIMAAGHPRVSFELDLFSTLEQHWNVDADYVRRKGRPDAVRTWAVGQAMALERSLTLYQGPLGQEGSFPEFYFFDCHTCHRQISDAQSFRASAVANPGRPIPSGTPAFNDENMIMLLAAARATSPGMAARFEADSRAFHAAIAQDRGAAIRAAAKLRADAQAMADSFASRGFARGEVFAIVDAVASSALAPRFTDYEGSVQAVMATDTLLNALVSGGYVGAGSAASIRAQINQAYAAVREPYAYRPGDFRAALARAASAIRALR